MPPRQVTHLVEATTWSSRLPVACAESHPCRLASSFASGTLEDNHTRPVQGWRDEFPAVQEAEMLDVAKQVYHPILPWQIRVIQLEGAPRFDDPLVCQIHLADLTVGRGVGVAALGSVIDYTAISYSWGYPKFTCSVSCSGIRFPITRNLSEALRYFRKLQPRFFWIDAICINQHNLIEKSRQIENMLLIFEKAARVQAWLGLSHEDEKSTLKACDALASLFSKARNGFNPKQVPAILYEDHSRNYISIRILLDSGICQIHLIQCQKGFAALIKSHQWYRRTWVLQEVFAASTLILHTNLWEISWSRFQDRQKLLLWALEEAFDKQVQAFADSIRLQELRLLKNLRFVATSDGDGRGYVNLMMNASESECTTACDKVYGVIGIIEGCSATQTSTDDRAQMFPIDYTLSDAQVHSAFVKHTITRTRSLEMLCIFEDRFDTASAIDLPSWVPIFSKVRARAFYKLKAEAFYDNFSNTGSAFGTQTIDKVSKNEFKWNELPLLSFELGEVVAILQPALSCVFSSSYPDSLPDLHPVFTIHASDADRHCGYGLADMVRILLRDFGFVIAKIRVKDLLGHTERPRKEHLDIEIGVIAPSSTLIGDLMVLPDAAKFPLLIRKSTPLAGEETSLASPIVYRHVGPCVAGKLSVARSGEVSTFSPHEQICDLLTTYDAAKTVGTGIHYTVFENWFRDIAQRHTELIILH